MYSGLPRGKYYFEWHLGSESNNVQIVSCRGVHYKNIISEISSTFLVSRIGKPLTPVCMFLQIESRVYLLDDNMIPLMKTIQML